MTLSKPLNKHDECDTGEHYNCWDFKYITEGDSIIIWSCKRCFKLVTFSKRKGVFYED